MELIRLPRATPSSRSSRRCHCQGAPADGVVVFDPTTVQIGTRGVRRHTIECGDVSRRLENAS